MTQEDKELLLKDLCARLGYGVKVCIKLPNHQEKTFEEQVGDLKELTIYGGYLVNSKGIDYRSFNLDIKPYLRPMSSMTEEDNLSLSKYVGCSIRVKYGEIYFPVIEDNTPDKWEKVFGWLNAHHFDYRGLIPMKLAIEAPKEMYEEKTS